MKCTSICHCSNINHHMDFEAERQYDCIAQFEAWCIRNSVIWGHLFDESTGLKIASFNEKKWLISTDVEKMREKAADIRHYLNEAHGFASMSPKGKENISTALDILDDLVA